MAGFLTDAPRLGRRFGPVAGLYVLLTWLTDAAFVGDAPDYVRMILASVGGDPRHFWDFGHLLWRPLGWWLFPIALPLTSRVFGPDPALAVTLTLLALSWTAGLASVLLVHAWVTRVCGRLWVANVASAGVAVSNGFLNYAQTGCSYVPGLAALLLGFHILARDGDRPDRAWRTAVVAGLALAAALCLWFLYVWAIPVALLSPLFLFGDSRARRGLVLKTTAALAGFTALVYGLVLLDLEIRTTQGLVAWIQSSSAYAVDIQGFSRMAFGFARSFLNMGNDGLLFKRFLLHDPFNPVSLADIFRVSLWKFALFYLFLASVGINLLRSARGRRILGLFLLNGALVVGFAVLFLGGDLERYFPLYPLTFLALAWSLRDERSVPALKAVGLVFVGIAAVTNVGVMARPALDRQQEATASRIATLQPLLKPHSRVVTAYWHDELVSFARSFPFSSVSRSGTLRIYSAVTLNTSQVAHWREDFAAQALAAWRDGGDVWISKRGLQPRPRREWIWAEGDDRCLSWTDIHRFFAGLETSTAVGGDDGFVLLESTPANEERLRSLAAAGDRVRRRERCRESARAARDGA